MKTLFNRYAPSTLKWLTVAFMFGAAYSEVRSTAARLERHEQVQLAADEERHQILVTLGRIEERIKAIQDTLLNKKP